MCRCTGKKDPLLLQQSSSRRSLVQGKSRAREDGGIATNPLASYVGPTRQEYYRKYDVQDNVNTQELMCLQRCNKTDN